ncbi:phage tail protein [Chitinimonas arctica]|uniref:Phage tail protein n=1 Tax=Chitinimonas arctica TaxID=2594795 RepID=A0A516SFB6_9NEIS|nr:tail fiber protein [Chitinimonas arctica]QDQ26854.1 phage tail protein [Chitinimonas arctica]
MSEPFLGEIKMVGFNFSPRGYAYCSAQILPIAQNTALFSLLGTTFGGNGQTTFGLPDLRGRSPVGANGSAGPGLQQVDLGEVGGTESTVLTLNNMPAHTHAAAANVAIPAIAASTNVAAAPSNITCLGPVSGGGRPGTLYSTDAPTTTLAPFNCNVTVGIAGGGQPFGIASPYLGINFIIALEGIFPSRN